MIAISKNMDGIAVDRDGNSWAYDMPTKKWWQFEWHGETPHFLADVQPLETSAFDAIRNHDQAIRWPTCEWVNSLYRATA